LNNAIPDVELRLRMLQTAHNIIQLYTPGILLLDDDSSFKLSFEQFWLQQQQQQHALARRFPQPGWTTAIQL